MFTLLAGAALAAALAASASGLRGPARAPSAFVPGGLLASAQAHPQRVF